MKDLRRFLFIAIVVLLGVGIYYHANLWPDHQAILSDDLTKWRIWTIISYPYWQLYGELNLETLDGNTKCVYFLFHICTSSSFKTVSSMFDSHNQNHDHRAHNHKHSKH